MRRKILIFCLLILPSVIIGGIALGFLWGEDKPEHGHQNPSTRWYPARYDVVRDPPATISTLLKPGEKAGLHVEEIPGAASRKAVILTNLRMLELSGKQITTEIPHQEIKTVTHQQRTFSERFVIAGTSGQTIEINLADPGEARRVQEALKRVLPDNALMNELPSVAAE